MYPNILLLIHWLSILIYFACISCSLGKPVVRELSGLWSEELGPKLVCADTLKVHSAARCNLHKLRSYRDWNQCILVAARRAITYINPYGIGINYIILVRVTYRLVTTQVLTHTITLTFFTVGCKQDAF